MNEKIEPEWDLFGRIESLEALKHTAEDGFILAAASYLLAFTALAVQLPATARRRKDSLIVGLKQSGLSPGLLEWLERVLPGICDEADELQ